MQIELRGIEGIKSFLTGVETSLSEKAQRVIYETKGSVSRITKVISIIEKTLDELSINMLNKMLKFISLNNPKLAKSYGEKILDIENGNDLLAIINEIEETHNNVSKSTERTLPNGGKLITYRIIGEKASKPNEINGLFSPTSRSLLLVVFNSPISYDLFVNLIGTYLDNKGITKLIEKLNQIAEKSPSKFKELVQKMLSWKNFNEIVKEINEIRL